METEQMAEVYGAPGTRPSDRDSKAARKQARAAEAARAAQPTLPGLEVKPKVSKKHKKKRKSLREMAYQTTQHAQAVMRHEMERGVHKPQKMGIILDEEFGVQTDVSAAALEIIEEHGDGLQLGMGAWKKVQAMIEAGIRLGQQES